MKRERAAKKRKESGMDQTNKFNISSTLLNAHGITTRSVFNDISNGGSLEGVVILNLYALDGQS